MIYRPNRRELIKFGAGAAAFAGISRAQTLRIPGPGGLQSAGGGSVGWSLVGHTSAASSGGGDVTTSGQNYSGANLIVLGVAYNSGATLTVKDSLSNSWSALTQYNTGAPHIQMWYCYSPATGSGQTFSTSTSGGTSYPSLFAMAFAGASSSPFDQQNGNNALGATIQPGSIAPSANNELIVSFLAIQNGSGPSINDSFTLLDSQAFSSGNAFGGASAYYIQTTAAATDPAWSLSGGETAANIASFT